MKFDVDDKNRCRLVCVKFHLNWCRFAVAVAKCLGGSLFGTQCIPTTLTVNLTLRVENYWRYRPVDVHISLANSEM